MGRADRAPMEQILRDTKVFSEEEVGIALELIDIVLSQPEQKDYIINVYDDGEVLGYYCVGPTPATEGTFDMYWIAVKPSAHGKGVGGKLNEHAERLIRSKGGRLIMVETSSQPKYEKTRRFYITYGYTEISRVRDYYRVGDDLLVFGKYI